MIVVLAAAAIAFPFVAVAIYLLVERRQRRLEAEHQDRMRRAALVAAAGLMDQANAEAADAREIGGVDAA